MGDPDLGPAPAELDARALAQLRHATLVCGALAVLAIVARWPAIARGELLFDSDNALGPLMSRAIWQGGYWPIMLDGQNYLGALDAYLLAPLVGIAGADPRFWLVGQTALLAFVVVPLACALGHRVGGTWGLVAAGLAVAIGSSEQLMLTASAPLGYLSNLAFGLGILLVATREGTLESGRSLALGVLVGAGWWNNPQVLVFVVPAMLACAARGELATSRSDGRFAVARRTASGQVGLLLVVGGALAAFASLAMPFTSVRGVSVMGFDISLERPERYLPRTVACIGLGLVILELVASRARRRTVARGAWFALGAAVGAMPYAVHKRWGPEAKVEPWMQFRLDDLGHHAADVRDHVMAAMFGGGVHGAIAAAVVVTLAVALVAGYRGEGIQLTRLRSRGLSAPVVAALSGVVLGAIMLLRGSFLGGPRHFLSMLVPIAAIVAWAAGALARRSVAAAAIFVLALATHGLIGVRQVPDALAARERPDRARLLRWLAAQQLSHGYGQYWVAFELSLLGGERLLIASDYDPMGNYDRFPEWRQVVERAPGQRVRLFDLEWPWDHQRLRTAHERPLGPVLERRRFGSRSVVLRYCRD